MSSANVNFYYYILRFHLCSWFIGIILHQRYWHWSMCQVVNLTSAAYLFSSFSLKVEAKIINFFPSRVVCYYIIELWFYFLKIGIKINEVDMLTSRGYDRLRISSRTIEAYLIQVHIVVSH